MMRKLGLIPLMLMACIEVNPDYTEKSVYFPPDTCMNALAAYEVCDWDTFCTSIIRDHHYPKSWEPAKITYELCYLDSPRCGALEEGCDQL